MNSAVSENARVVSLTLADQVFERLQQAIVEGDIPAGSKISEAALARNLGISRAPLREALTRLEACHLIERRPNIGARVVALSPRHLLEIYHIRESLEGLAARLASENMSNEDIAGLARLLDAHRPRVKRERSYLQKEGDMDFHYRIVLGSKNSRLINMYCHDLYYLIRLYRYQFGMVSKRVHRAFSEHEHIVDALRQRDGELAQFLVARHIKAARLNIEKMLAARPAVSNLNNGERPQ